MSKLILYDFECPSGHRFEELVATNVLTAVCPCGGHATRQISPVRIDMSKMSLSSSASPESIDHFDYVHRQRKAIEEKSFADHGDYGKAAGSD